MSKPVYFIGVDVGTGSARAALISDKGKIIKVAVQQIKTWIPKNDFYEQSSDNIWNSCVSCIKDVTDGILPEDIKGIGFDATCSLVVFDAQNKPLSVSPTGCDEQNVILWMDHRASKEAETISNLKHSVLQYVGGKISLEMQIPKLMWLKKQMKTNCWDKASIFFDLPDFLTWKATGCDSRSLCSLVCKWTYESDRNGKTDWNKSFLSEIGLDDLLENNCYKVGSNVLPPGAFVGKGLSATAAKELGLKVGTPVGTSLIDAHAGGLGLMGCHAEGINPEFKTKLGLICGTSTCHMAVSSTPVFAPGVWGPYYSAMIPGMWLNEGGQSVSGKLVDHIIESHPATAEIKNKIGDMHIQKYLSDLLIKLAKQNNLPNFQFLTQNLHVWPDFHGNRSPVADPTLTGAICGLTLSSGEENLAFQYLATIQAICYGTRHIMDVLKKSGYSNFESILICGGLTKNSLFIQTQADVVNLPVVCPEEVESVLLGSAILGACAAKYFDDMESAIKSMGGRGTVVKPNKDIIEYHNKKYKVFLKMLDDQLAYRKIMM